MDSFLSDTASIISEKQYNYQRFLLQLLAGDEESILLEEVYCLFIMNRCLKSTMIHFIICDMYFEVHVIFCHMLSVETVETETETETNLR